MKITRRRALIGLGGAALAVPAIQYGRWQARDFDRPGFSPDLPAPPEGEQAWSNWSGLQQATPQSIFVPKSEDELAAMMRTAPGPIRPVGSGHSFTALVPSEGTIVDISRLSGLISADPASGQATLGAGTRLRHAARLLSEVGLGFPNMPDIDVQTLAGSFSTATHGTGRSLKALHDTVAGFRLVTPRGEILDVTRAGNPDLFQAGKVSLGALGVITQVTLDLVPSYALKKTAIIVPIEKILNEAEALSHAHRHFESLLLPHTGHALLLVHDLHEGPVTGRPPSLDDDSLADLKMMRDHLGWWPWARQQAFGAFLATQPEERLTEISTDEYWKLLTTSRPTKFNEMEYHVPVENGLEALKQVIAVLERRKDTYYPVEFRYTGQDDAWLSPFNDGVRNSIAVHAQASEPFEYLLEQIEPLLRQAGGRPHWGKLHTLGRADFAALYPEFEAFNAIRAALDPEGKMLNPHLQTLFGSEG